MPRDFMECGGKRSATPLWLLFVSHASPNQLLRPKRRRASLAAALHMALTDTLNRSQGKESEKSCEELRGHKELYCPELKSCPLSRVSAKIPTIARTRSDQKYSFGSIYLNLP